MSATTAELQAYRVLSADTMNAIESAKLTDCEAAAKKVIKSAKKPARKQAEGEHAGKVEKATPR